MENCYALLTGMSYRVSFVKTKGPIQVSVTDISNNPHLKRIMSEHDNSKRQPCGPHDLVPRALPQSITKTLGNTSHTIQQCAVDGVSQYASAVLKDSQLLLEFKDAIREGDGPRILG